MLDPTALYFTFCIYIRTIASNYNVTVTSWWRSHKRNRDVGGSPTSFHLEGLGADLVPDDPADRPAIIATARSLGLQAVDEGDHIHVELDTR